MKMCCFCFFWSNFKDRIGGPICYLTHILCMLQATRDMSREFVQCAWGPLVFGFLQRKSWFGVHGLPYFVFFVGQEVLHSLQ